WTGCSARRPRRRCGCSSTGPGWSSTASWGRAPARCCACSVISRSVPTEVRMPDRDARIAELAREILALVENGDPGEAPPPDPGALLPPANFSAAYDASTRRVTCAWTPQSDAVEIHERWKNPANTL